jgi:hypothetical protein
MTAAAAFVFLVVGVGILWRLGVDGKEVRPPVPELRLRVTVRRGDTVLDLARAVPLYSGNSRPGSELEGDDLQIVCELPTGLQASAFWFDTEAILHALPAKQMEQEGKSTLVWPELDKGRMLQGRPGTEVIFVCADRSGLPALEDIRPLFADADPWPEMRTSAVLEFGQQTVRMRGDRGPSTEDRVRPDGPVVRRAEALQKALATRFESFGGVAFPNAGPLARR